MAPQTRSSERGEVGKSAPKKTTSSTIGKGKVTRSSNTIGGGGGRKGKETNTIGGGEKGIPTWRATKKLVLRDDSDDSSSSSGPGGGGGSVIGGGEKGIPTWRATKKLGCDDSDDSSSRSGPGGVSAVGGGEKGIPTSDDSSSDPDPAGPDKETVLANCNKMKRKLELQSKNELESLAPFLIGKGVRAGRTYQDTYHEALVDLIERNRDVAKTFSKQIDLKDIELTVLQFQAISALGDCFFHAPQDGQELVIGDSIKRLVRQWLGDSCDEYKMMKVWAQSPTWILSY